MPQFIYDRLNSFGKAALASVAAFPDTIDLAGSDVSRMTVDLKTVSAAAGGTSITVSIVGSDDSAFSSTETLGSKTLTLANINAGGTRIAVSPNKCRYIKVTFTKSGTFTAGTMEALLNSYLGK
jgi:hypothetical protein